MASKQEIDAFYSEVDLRVGAKIRLALEIYASESKNAIVDETLAGRFANGTGFKYKSRSYDKKRQKRGNETGFVDFYYSGQTTRSIETSVNVKDFSFKLTVRGRAAQITEWQQRRYDWFSFKRRSDLIRKRANDALRRRLESDAGG